MLAVNRPGAVYSHAYCDVGYAYLRLCASCCQSKPRRTVSACANVGAYFAFEVNAATFDNITFTTAPSLSKVKEMCDHIAKFYMDRGLDLPSKSAMKTFSDECRSNYRDVKNFMNSAFDKSTKRRGK